MAQEPKQRTALVEALQDFVREAQGSRRTLDDTQAKPLVDQRNPEMALKVKSQNAIEGGLRVTHPSPSVVTAEIVRSINPHSVEFYITRPREDGVVETRLLGSARYRDSDGKWSARFVSERFSRKPDEPSVIHAEALGPDGRLLAANFIAPIV